MCMRALGLQGSGLLRKQGSTVYFCPKTLHAENVRINNSEFHVVKFTVSTDAESKSSANECVLSTQAHCLSLIQMPRRRSF